MRLELVAKLREDALRRLEGGEIGGAHRHGRGAAGDELERVRPGHHAAHADERRVRERLRDLGDHAQGDGLDRRAAEAAGAVAEERAQGLPVEHQRLEGVDQREAVGAGARAQPRPISVTSRTLGVSLASRKRPGGLAAGGDAPPRWRRVGADLQAAGDVGARDVELVALDARRGRLRRRGQVRLERARPPRRTAPGSLPPTLTITGCAQRGPLRQPRRSRRGCPGSRGRWR